MAIKHILIDQDGVLADFVGGAFDMHGRSDLKNKPYPSGVYEVAEVLGITDDEFWHPLNASRHLFWENLNPLPWVKELTSLANEFASWTICTKPSNDPFCAAGKIMWLKRQFGSDFNRYILANHKHHMARHDHVLIDDFDRNVNEFREHGGIGILFPQPWNSNNGLCGDRIGYVREELERVRNGIHLR